MFPFITIHGFSLTFGTRSEYYKTPNAIGLQMGIVMPMKDVYNDLVMNWGKNKQRLVNIPVSVLTKGEKS